MSLLNSLTSKMLGDRAPNIAFSLIVIAYDMDRELPRTLHSLSRRYQTGASDINYEVIVVDNGSPSPVSRNTVESFGPEFKLLSISDASPSPAAAVNAGVAQAMGQYVGIIIDGARILSPGILGMAAKAFAIDPNSLVSVAGLHLGPEIQRHSVKRGYSSAIEDQLLERIDWLEDGYRLFEISCWAGSSNLGWAGPMAESNCAILPRDLFIELEGFDEGFSSVGGGLVNLDFYRRCCEAENLGHITLLGEGCFHQLHGGVTTGGGSTSPKTFDELQEEYRRLRGKDYVVPQNRTLLLGEIPPCAVHLLQQGAAQTLLAKHDAQATHRAHLLAVGLLEYLQSDDAPR
ncbi:MAG: hypothetical protein ACI9GW_003321 [Halieaceae bacterium]|jgi:hypothetical protein